MAHLGPVTRTLIRARGARSEDPRDVQRDLRRALKRAAGHDGEPRQAQLAGEPLELADYAQRRERALRRRALTRAPELEPGRYALVLFVCPSATEQFVRHKAAAHLTTADGRGVQADDRARGCARRDARRVA